MATDKHFAPDLMKTLTEPGSGISVGISLDELAVDEEPMFTTEETEERVVKVLMSINLTEEMARVVIDAINKDHIMFLRLRPHNDPVT